MLIPYEFLDHPADFKLRAFGKDLPELFINSALGMMEYLFGKNVFLKATVNSELIQITSDSRESLLVDWLSRILYLVETQHCAYTHYSVSKFSDTEIEAKAGFIQAQSLEGIKAVTYNELSIRKTDDNILTPTIVFFF